jgi:hypothetical protein
MADADDIWAEIKALLRWTAIVFGAPVDLAQQETMPRREAERLRRWLAVLEAMARALLLALAARLPRPAPSASSKPRRSRDSREMDKSRFETNESRPETDESQDSQRWTGVSFPALPRPPRPRTRTDGGTHRTVVWTEGLARRFEAVIRVAENPEAYARRLARRLRAEPAAAPRLLRAPGLRERWLPRETLEAAQAEGRRALAAFQPDTG